MRAWSRPRVPSLPGDGPIPRLHDTATGTLVEARPADGRTASLYVCGITPYDATHLGHAATYLAFDTLVRVWLDAGLEVVSVQNTTDVDDPLLERAAATGVDWEQLAEEQTELFRGDMAALRVLPPDHYVAVTEVVAEVGAAVDALRELGFAYAVPSEGAGDDLYFDTNAASTSAEVPWTLGDESRYDIVTMLTLSAERGGDPDRAGKRDPLDPLLWRAARDGEPAWESAVGRGRPGWHIECTVIALRHVSAPLTVNAGGSDLVFPHHEFSAAHGSALTSEPWAQIYAHAGMIGYEGEKMSKSLGNLVLVSRLVASGVDPRAIRLALLDGAYRADRAWTDALLRAAQTRLESWLGWAGSAGSGEPVVLADIRAALATDLNTAAALDAVDAAIARGTSATDVDLDAIDALLGVGLR